MPADRPVGPNFDSLQPDGFVGCLQNHSSRSIPEQHRRGPVGEVEEMRQLLSTDHEHLVVPAPLDHLGGDVQGVDPTGTCRVEIEHRSVGCAKFGLYMRGSARDHRVGGAGGQNDEIDIGRFQTGSGESLLRGDHGHVGNVHVSDAPLLDTGTGGDPIVAGVCQLLKIAVRKGPRAEHISPIR